MNFIDGGVTSAKGFSAANCNAKIKYMNRDDMAMIFCEVPCDVAGTFTKNVVKAAPVLWDKKVCVEEKKAQTVVINAGIANACTGEEGFSYCKKTADKCADVLNLNPSQVLVASTGVIGMQLPMDCIENGAAPRYVVSWNNSDAIKYSGLNSMYSVQYELYAEEMKDFYGKLSDALKDVMNVPMQKHEILNEDVRKITYENGTIIYINRGDEEVLADGIRIPAKWYEKKEGK